MSKLRTDSWASALTEEQSWQLYYKARGLKWNEAAAWAVKEFGVDAPSRTAFYAWLGRMRSEESAHRLEQAATAAAEAAALARKTAKDEALIGAYKAMAAELALRTGSADEAAKFVNMAAALSERRLRARELDIKARAQETKDEQLKLAREKFEAAEKRLAAVQEAVKAARATDGGLSEEALAKIEQAVGML
jgi:hypothetical protein